MGELFYTSMSIFAGLPLLAALPALAFYFMYRSNKRRLIAVTSALWALYMIYELSIALGITCPEGCNIRVDLLVIYPFLLIMSAVATFFYFRCRG